MDLIEKSTESLSLSKLGSLTEFDWRKVNWPIVVSIPREKYQKMLDGRYDDSLDFWREIFNSDNFVRPGKYDTDGKIIFVLHSFKNRDGEEEIFKAVSTPSHMFEEDIANVLNYDVHGKPCELRSRVEYPTCNFWSDFYDNLKPEEQERYPIPSRVLREKYIRGNFLSGK